jgi:hypothetical protein
MADAATCTQTMVTVMKIALLVCIVCAGSVVSSASTSPRKLTETRSSDHGWEADMVALDLLSSTLQQEPDSTGYIIIYGARRGHRNDVKRRMECMKNYLLQRRGIPAASLKVINGGYREYAMVELWVAPNGSLAPVPRPTIKAKNIRFKRGATEYSCDL